MLNIANLVTFRQRGSLLLFLAVCLYFIAFIPANLTGAKDPNMLAVFETDEYAIFPSVFRVFTPGSSPIETLKNLVGYSPRFYGYPFFFVSALVILPLRLFFTVIDRNGIETTLAYNGAIIPVEHTTAYMIVLRQLSVLFMLLAIMILIWLWTRFQSPVQTILLLILLGSMTAVFKNNLWLHPDSLATFFVVLTIFSFTRDNLRFGKWYYRAAIFCGLATGTKVLGLFFLPVTLPVYLLLGIVDKKISYRSALKYGIYFVLLMLTTVVITNPLLWIPQGVAIVIDSIRENSQALKAGFGGIRTYTGFFPWYEASLKHGFGFWWFYLMVLIAAGVSLVSDRDKRLLNIVILTWSLPFCWYVIHFVSSGPRERFFIPILLPLMSCLSAPWLWNLKHWFQIRHQVAIALSLLLLLGCGVQLSSYLKNDFNLYWHVLNREHTSPVIDFYHQLDQVYLSSRSETDPPLTVYRSPGIYIAPSRKVNSVIRWSLTKYDDIKLTNPDLIVLSGDVVRNYSNPDYIKKGANPSQLQPHYEFYKDAIQGRIKGYDKLLTTDVGFAFIKKTIK